jgi:hypothetical protein
MDTYTEAHLFVAAIRVLQHQKKTPPSLEEVCSMIGSSTESGYALCRTLKKAGIIETLEDPYSVKLFVSNHLSLETLPREEKEENSLAKELEKFKKEKSGKEKKFAEMQAELEKKKKDKLSEIEAKFKAQMEKYKKD